MMEKEDKKQDEGAVEIPGKIDKRQEGLSEEDFEKTFSRAMNTLLVILFASAVGVYLLLKAVAGQEWAELWMVVAYGWSLLFALEALSPKLRSIAKENTSKIVSREPCDEDEADDAEDIEQEDLVEEGKAKDEK